MCTYVTNSTTAATPTVMTIGLQIGAGTMDTVSLGNAVANSGERYGYRLVRDMTSRFTSDWSGTSQTVTCRVNISSIATANHGFKLRITYDYDDTASTHIKTVRIPIESTRATLTTSAQTLGGATAIPALKNGYFPESSVTIRNAVVELYGNELSSAAVATLTMDYGGASSTACWLSTNTTINSDCFVHGMYDITAQALTAATALNATSTTTTGRFGNIGGWITVTYEFDPTSTTIFNSLFIGAFDTAGWMGGTTSTDADAWGRTIYIEEPGTITLMESAVILTMVDSGGFTCNVAIGAQANQAYTVSAGGVQCCNYTLCHRIDAGGQRGTAFATLARGVNSYLATVYSGTAQAGWNLAGCMILNYTSGLSAQGVGAHAQSRYLSILNTVGTTSLNNTSTAHAPAIPETDYWLVGACIELHAVTTALAAGAQAVQAERAAGEGEGLGWEPLFVGQYRSDNEAMTTIQWGASRRAWRRWPQDSELSDRMNIETARLFRIDTNPASGVALGLWYTYHTISYSISGTITNSAGGTVTINAHKSDTGEKIGSTTRSGNGSYTIPWWDNVANVYVEASEDSTHLGRSTDSTATGSP